MCYECECEHEDEYVIPLCNDCLSVRDKSNLKKGRVELAKELLEIIKKPMNVLYLDEVNKMLTDITDKLEAELK